MPTELRERLPNEIVQKFKADFDIDVAFALVVDKNGNQHLFAEGKGPRRIDVQTQNPSLADEVVEMVGVTGVQRYCYVNGKGKWVCIP